MIKALAVRAKGERYDKNDMVDAPSGGQFLSEIYAPRWKGFGDSNPDAWRRIMHGYLACTSFADWNIGRVLKTLDRSPYAGNTIVIVTSDNGFHVGEKNHYGKSTLWEKSANVPMLVGLPGQQHAGETCDSAVGLIDLYPTLCTTCSLESPPQPLIPAFAQSEVNLGDTGGLHGS